jgi:hypothetical protein
MTLSTVILAQKYLFIHCFQEEQESLTTPKEQISFNEDQLDYEPEVNGD